MLSTLDWSLILAYIAFALVVGALTSRSASKSLASYFVAGRSLPWWWIGISMVATTFASDTPLVVAGIVAKRGISGNWFWWAWVIGNVGVAVFFAPLWRRAGVVTDAELIELRYGSGPGAFLRGFKAVYSSLIVNLIVMGWVFRAMAKIAQPFLRWEEILPPNWWTVIEANWPAVLTMGSVNESVTVALLVLMIALYASAGGIRGVMLTDLFQFVIAMTGSCLFAWYAVEAVGGLSGLSVKLGEIYGAEGAGNILSFLPPEGAGWAGAQVILIYLFVVWWAHNNADGGGYIGQRLCSARTPRDAQAGAFLFTVGNYVLRPWPWILIGLVSLILVPKGMDALPGTMEAKILADREAAYPLLMEKLLPAGILGLVLVGLLGAFMSTVDTHLNWGVSYLVNDVYARFIRKGAGAREVVFVSRLGVLIMALGAFAVAGQISSLEVAWKFHISLGAGLGLPVILRWLWWRANAWTEISGMLSAGATALYLHWEGEPPAFPVLLAAEVGVGFLAMLIATLITRPAKAEVLRDFWTKVHPPGVWGRVRGEDRRAAPVLALAGLWLALSVFVFALMFLVGALLVGTWGQVGGLALLAGFSLCTAWGIDRRYRYGILFV
ncbi:MAG: Na+:solute symporter [Nitrospinae bacterium]|nr:Na+:solute symporter [Nitrospinota bacterium]